jgi:ribosome-associated protein
VSPGRAVGHEGSEGGLPIGPREIAVTCARIADAKKARDILALDLRRLFFLTDYFVIATGDNSIQLRAIADEIERQLGEAGLAPLAVAGRQEARWILMDYVDVVVHLFLPEARKYYDLELLWGDAPRARWRLPTPRPPSTSP